MVRKILIALSGILVLAVAAGFLAGELVTGSATTATEVLRTDLPVQSVRIPAADGTPVHGWLSYGEDGSGVVLLVHYGSICRRMAKRPGTASHSARGNPAMSKRRLIFCAGPFRMNASARLAYHWVRRRLFWLNAISDSVQLFWSLCIRRSRRLLKIA